MCGSGGKLEARSWGVIEMERTSVMKRESKKGNWFSVLALFVLLVLLAMPMTSKDMERLILTDGWVPTGNTNTQRKNVK